MFPVWIFFAPDKILTIFILLIVMSCPLDLCIFFWLSLSPLFLLLCHKSMVNRPSNSCFCFIFHSSVTKDKLCTFKTSLKVKPEHPELTRRHKHSQHLPRFFLLLKLLIKAQTCTLYTSLIINENT